MSNLKHLFAAFAEMERGIPGTRLRRGARGEGTGNTPRMPRRVFRRDEALKLRGEGISW
jgi:hypothetical protein